MPTHFCLKFTYLDKKKFFNKLLLRNLSFETVSQALAFHTIVKHNWKTQLLMTSVQDKSGALQKKELPRQKAVVGIHKMPKHLQQFTNGSISAIFG